MQLPHMRFSKMLTLQLPTLSPLSLSYPKCLLRRNPSSCFRSFSVNMASPTVEHVVLFKVRDGVDSSKVNDMLAGVNALTSLPQVLHLTAGPLLRSRPASFPFTHLLHSRYPSKEDLDAYRVHPSHVNVAKEHVYPTCDDIMAVDWVADGFQGPVSAAAGSAVRVALFKLKENLGHEVKNEIVEMIRGMKETLGVNVQLTVGENFSPARAKGFSFAAIAIFPGVRELEAADSDREMELQREKVREHMESVIVVDYVIPPPQTASL